MNNCGIYSITNLKNGKRYIGQSSNLAKRKTTHLWLLRSGKHFNRHLQSAWNLQGESDFAIEVLELCSPEETNSKEIYYISKYDSMLNGYNLCAGGESSLGRTCGEVSRAKISIANRGRVKSEEALAKHSLASKLNWTKPDYVAKQKRRKPPVPWLGKQLSDDHKRNIGLGGKGRVVKDEVKHYLSGLYAGENSITAKLTKRDVVNIRWRYLNGERQCQIKSDYPQITAQTMYDIVRNRRWNSVPNTIEELSLERRSCAGE